MAVLRRNLGSCSEHSVHPIILPPLRMRPAGLVDVSSGTGSKPGGMGLHIGPCHGWLGQEYSESSVVARVEDQDPTLGSWVVLPHRRVSASFGVGPSASAASNGRLSSA
jgi:hypothetical protein